MKLKWAARVPRSERPAILNEKHNDWIRPLRGIPRSWTSWLMVRNPCLTYTDPPTGAPRKLFGNAIDIICPHYEREYPGGCDQLYPKPIPDPGQWWFGWPFYFAIQTKTRWHARIGFRWDNVDGYYALSATIKRYK